MKKRYGFVSNSSTTSFICAVCGAIESGRDMSLSDMEMSMCVNGHEFHNSCAKLGSYSEIDYDEIGLDKKKYIIDRINKSKYIDDKEKEIKDIEGMEEGELEEAFSDWILDCGLPEEFCPICSMKEVDNDDVVKYLYKKFNTTKKETIKEIKNKFKSYSEFQKFLKGDKDEN